MGHRKQDDDTGLSEMKAFGEELVATGARYIEAGKRWFDARRDDSTARRDAREHGAERSRPAREPEDWRRGPHDDGHGRSAWLGGRPSRPDLHDHEAHRGAGHGHAFWDEPPGGVDPRHGPPGRQEHHWEPPSPRWDSADAAQPRRSDDHLSDWGHRARPGQQHTDAYGDHGRHAHGSGSGGATPRGWRGVGPKGYIRSDARISEDVCEQLMHDDAIDARRISVQVHDGIVSLEGQVPTRAIKHRVEDLVEGCSGVRDVENRLRVQRGNAPGERDTRAGGGTEPAATGAAPASPLTGHAQGLSAQGAAATSEQPQAAATGPREDASDAGEDSQRP